MSKIFIHLLQKMDVRMRTIAVSTWMMMCCLYRHVHPNISSVEKEQQWFLLKDFYFLDSKILGVYGIEEIKLSWSCPGKTKPAN